AVKLGPNLTDVLSFGALVLACSGRAAEGISLIERAFTLSPNYDALFLGVLGNAYRLSGRAEEAIIAFRAYHARNPGFGLADIVMIQEQAGRLEEARQTAAQLLSARPNFTVASWRRTQFRADTAQMATDLASLRAAGVPEE